MKFILGEKIEMTQRFLPDGKVVPVTVVKAGPCVVTQVKNTDKDHYEAVQIGFGRKRQIAKALSGHLKGLENFRFLKEFRSTTARKRGDVITAGVFQPGDKVDVVAHSKGKGFQGVVKRHKFAGSRATHGNKDQLRMPGSIGATDPQRVFKGKRMAGQMGNQQTTVKNLEIIEVDTAKNLLLLKGAVPGGRHNLLEISGAGEMTMAETDNKKETPQPPAQPAPAEAAKETK